MTENTAHRPECPFSKYLAPDPMTVCTCFSIGDEVRVIASCYVGTVIMLSSERRWGMVRVKFAEGDFTDAYITELELTHPE